MYQTHKLIYSNAKSNIALEVHPLNKCDAFQRYMRLVHALEGTQQRVTLSEFSICDLTDNANELNQLLFNLFDT